MPDTFTSTYLLHSPRPDLRYGPKYSAFQRPWLITKKVGLAFLNPHPCENEMVMRACFHTVVRSLGAEHTVILPKTYSIL